MTHDLVKRTDCIHTTEDGRFVVTDLALVTSRRKGWRVADAKHPELGAIGFVKTLGAAAKLVNRYLEFERAGKPWPRPLRRLGLPE